MVFIIVMMTRYEFYLVIRFYGVYPCRVSCSLGPSEKREEVEHNKTSGGFIKDFRIDRQIRKVVGV